MGDSPEVRDLTCSVNLSHSLYQLTSDTHTPYTTQSSRSNFSLFMENHPDRSNI